MIVQLAIAGSLRGLVGNLHLCSGQLCADWFHESQNATDVVAPDAQGQITQYQQSSTVYASINHKLTPKLLGTVIGRWQHSVFNEGLYNNQALDYYSLGLNLSYSLPRIFRVMLAII